MAQKRLLVVVVVLVLLLIASLAVTSYVALNNNRGPEPLYVGVTYCGNSVMEAKELIDEVKDCTNLFVLQSGTLQWNIEAMNEIGDYAIASGLNYTVSGGTGNTVGLTAWLNDAKERWGEQFIGIYYNDEPGGKMLDAHLDLEKMLIQEMTEDGPSNAWSILSTINKEAGGKIVFQDPVSRIYYSYLPDGKVTVDNPLVTYYPNGTITIEDYKMNNFYTPENITKYPSQILTYEQVLKQNPIQNNDDAARVFVNRLREEFEGRYLGCLNKTQLDQSILVFTADYGLYWWDYQGGYNMVLAELGWNNSITQEIGLVRGAANLHNKQWGTILTWKYTQTPYLPNGPEMFEQMKTSYEAGANYIIVFNYSENATRPNTLQDEHFQALERFWNDVVQNPNIVHGGIKAEAALVLPQNYGWGMRNPNDSIWGIWQPDSTSQEIWNQLQAKIDQYGTKLDIVYEDPNHPITGKYPHTHYWNQP